MRTPFDTPNHFTAPLPASVAAPGASSGRAPPSANAAALDRHRFRAAGDPPGAADDDDDATAAAAYRGRARSSVNPENSAGILLPLPRKPRANVDEHDASA
jgi:hypothetical protein